jgi:F0F1-type ATP synthase assembly protein I
VTEENKPSEPERPPSSANKSGLDQVAKYSELALIMPAGCAGGWIIGAYLDIKFHTHWMFLAGLTLGFIGGFAQVIRIAMKNSK